MNGVLRQLFIKSRYFGRICVKTIRFVFWLTPLALVLTSHSFAQTPQTNSPMRLFGAAIMRLTRIIEPHTNEPPRTFTVTLQVLKAEGLPKELIGQKVDVAFQAPDHLRLSAHYEGEQFTVARDGQELWIHEPGKNFGVVSSTNKPLFSTAPEKKDTAPLDPLKLPIPPEQLQLLPLFADIETFPDEKIGETECLVFKATPKPEAISNFNLRRFSLKLWVRQDDSFPLRVEYAERKGMDVQIELINPQFSDAWPGEKWKLQPAKDDKIESVARSHLTHFFSVALGRLNEKIPTLGPATGERRVLAREGNGRLESIDGTRVLILKGTPEEMGRQHGKLLKKDIRDLMDHILYGVGVGSSFEKGRGFFGEIEAAQQRLVKFMDKRYLREMDALADASGVQREEVRLGNFFPELFHCTGFAVFGKATQDGRVYHGRVLDYLRGLGLDRGHDPGSVSIGDHRNLQPAWQPDQNPQRACRFPAGIALRTNP